MATSRLHIHKGNWTGYRLLLGQPVPTISAFLTGRDEWTPKQLNVNEGIAFQGSIVLGMGFILPEQKALAMLERNPRNADVIFPYLIGDDLNSHPRQKPSRWVINFWDWPEERARTYPEPFSIVEMKVKSGRMQVNRKIRRERWWQFAELASGLYHAIGRGDLFEKHPDEWELRPKLERVICCSEVTKYLCFSLVANVCIFSANLDVFASPDPALLAILQSSLHDVWARQNSSKLETRLKYSPGNAFLTFVRQESSSRLSALGKLLDDHRGLMCQNHSMGFTDFYNQFHDPAVNTADFAHARELQVEIDHTVAKSYDLDIALQHGFHEASYLRENDRIRFTVSEEARRKILDRLSELNRERYEEEVAQGLHDKKKPTKGTRATKPSKSAAGATAEPFAAPPQPTLFPMKDQMGLWEAPPQPSPAEKKGSEAGSDGLSRSAADLVAWLRKESGWRSRSEALEALGLSTSEWNQAIQDLLAAGLAERTGEKRGTRYRAK